MQALPAPGPPPPSPGPVRAQLSRAWKSSERVPTAETPTRAQELGPSGEDTRASSPSPTLEERREAKESGEQARSLELQDEPFARGFPASAAPATRATAAPTPGSALGPFLPPDGGRPSPLLFSQWVGVPVPHGLTQGSCSSRPSAVRTRAGAWCSRVRTRHLRHPSHYPWLSSPLPVWRGFGTSGCPLASLASTCAGRRAWARRPALPPPPLGARAARFPVQQYSEGGTSGEHPAELPPGLGLGCGCERQSPVSWLPVPSGPGQRPRSRDVTPPPASPGILGHTWLSPQRWRQQDPDGATRGQGVSALISGQISLLPLDPHPLLDPCRGGGPPSNLSVG